MTDNPEKTISTRDIYTGKTLSVKVSTVEIKDQKYSQREIVLHRGGACIVAVNEEKKVVLVRQFRKAAEEYLLELPAGKLESKEDPVTCVKRELTEETGYQAQEVEFIQSFYTSPGFCTEKLYLYFAHVQGEQVPLPEPDERIEIVKLTIPEALDLIKEQKIIDAKTLIGLYWLERKAKQEGWDA